LKNGLFRRHWCFIGLAPMLARTASILALSEIGRVQKTVHILRTLDDEDYRRTIGRELNKGEASHDLSQFLCFGKEGVLRGREFSYRVHTFSCLSVLLNAVVAWNMIQIGEIVGQLRGDGHEIDDQVLSHVTPLLRKHINPLRLSI
jgi:TnpA family transposase